MSKPHTAGQSPALVLTHPLIEEILDDHHDHARGDARGWASYRGHVYRVFNLARALAPERDHRDDKLAIAAAFHDIDMFSSLDYLGPSIATMDAWLHRTGRAAWAEELAVVVAKHHHLSAYRGRHAELAEALRRADLADLTQGLVRLGMPRGHVSAVRQSIDVGVFFTRSIPRAIAAHLIRHPLDPLPIVRARRALQQAGHHGADR